jgi:hypothetical protein
LRADVGFDAAQTVHRVRTGYAFVTELEPVEEEFLAGVRYWLGDLGARRAGAPKDWPHPLGRLFDGVPDVTHQGRDATWDSIRVHGQEPID